MVTRSHDVPLGPRYTCKEYREEMTLLNLQRRLYQSDLSEDEKKQVSQTIERLKKEMGME
jgi:hypothetical protein